MSAPIANQPEMSLEEAVSHLKGLFAGMFSRPGSVQVEGGEKALQQDLGAGGVASQGFTEEMEQKTLALHRRLGATSLEVDQGPLGFDGLGGGQVGQEAGLPLGGQVALDEVEHLTHPLFGKSVIEEQPEDHLIGSDLGSHAGSEAKGGI